MLLLYTLFREGDTRSLKHVEAIKFSSPYWEKKDFVHMKWFKCHCFKHSRARVGDIQKAEFGS